jgi:hypothetical protein
VIRGSSDNRIGGNTLTASSEYGTFLDEQQARAGLQRHRDDRTRHLRRRDGVRLRNTARTEATDNVVQDVVSHGFKVDGVEDRDIRSPATASPAAGPTPCLSMGASLTSCPPTET